MRTKILIYSTDYNRKSERKALILFKQRYLGHMDNNPLELGLWKAASVLTEGLNLLLKAASLAELVLNVNLETQWIEINKYHISFTVLDHELFKINSFDALFKQFMN